MLHNPNWTQGKPDPFALPTLVSWLDVQEPKQRYTYIFGTECLLARYFTDHGYSSPHLTSNLLFHGDGYNRDVVVLPKWFDAIAGLGRGTFRAARRRAHLVHAFSYATLLWMAVILV